VRQGATVTTDRCDVSIRTPHADARVRELADFLVGEDFEGQFRLDDDGDAAPLLWWRPGSEPLGGGDRNHLAGWSRSRDRDQAGSTGAAEATRRQEDRRRPLSR